MRGFTRWSRMFEREACCETSNASPLQCLRVEEREAIRDILSNPRNPRPDFPHQPSKTERRQAEFRTDSIRMRRVRASSISPASNESRAYGTGRFDGSIRDSNARLPKSSLLVSSLSGCSVAATHGLDPTSGASFASRFSGLTGEHRPSEGPRPEHAERMSTNHGI